jgi:hypothetical protein
MKQPVNEQFIRMQKLAGIITENFDYQERKAGDVIVMDDKTMDDILDNPELQDYINPKSFTRNNKGEIVLGVDHMDYEQFDKLANFLGIKY